MTHNREVEDLLRNTMAPHVVESGHRQRLKNQLIREMRKEKPIMTIRTFLSKRVTLTLGICLALVLGAGAWAGISKIRPFVIFQTGDFTTEVLEDNVQTLPDGKIKQTIKTKVKCSYYCSDDPNATQEQADAVYQEIQKLIAEKNYEFLGESISDDGIKIYNYQFTLSDGNTIKHGSNVSLE